MLYFNTNVGATLAGAFSRVVWVHLLAENASTGFLERFFSERRGFYSDQLLSLTTRWIAVPICLFYSDNHVS